MGIEVVVEANDGTKLASVGDPKNILHRVLPALDNTRYQYLNRIDWYGDTVFNRYQIPFVLKELEHLAQTLRNSDELALIEKIQNLAIQCETEPHQYLKFYGD